MLYFFLCNLVFVVLEINIFSSAQYLLSFSFYYLLQFRDKYGRFLLHI